MRHMLQRSELTLRAVGVDFYVVDRGTLIVVRHAFNLDSVAGPKCQRSDPAARRRIRVRFSRGQLIVRDPLIDQLIVNRNAEDRLAVLLIEVFHVQFIPTGGPTRPLASAIPERL